MHIQHKDRVATPFLAPFGERIYELVGRTEGGGGTPRHSLAHVHAPPGARSPRHYHRVLEETYYVLEGEARVLHGERMVTLRPGEALLIPPGTVHQLFNEGTAPLEMLVVCAPAWSADDSFEA
ncbi:MAG: cupin domain-containing protein [Gemmatimonadales bacterium]|nr:cupin domain-containing protein [Gemmatimonadales bacterium]